MLHHGIIKTPPGVFLVFSVQYEHERFGLLKVIINGLAVEYQDEGEGPVLVLVHGWGQTLATFDHLAALLGKGLRVIRLDLPGFGGSEKPAETWGVSQYAGFLKAFFAKLDLEPEILLGHSMGGQIGIYAVATNQVRPRKLILLNSAGVRRPDSVRNQAFKAAAKAGKVVTSLPGLRGLRDHLRRRLYHAAGNPEYLDAGVMADVYRKVIAQDVRAEASRLKVPTLLIYGDQDTETPAEDGRLLQQQIAGSRIEILPGASHFSYIDQPDKVVQLITEFAHAPKTT